MHFKLCDWFGSTDVQFHVEDHIAVTTPIPGEDRMQQQAAKLKVWGFQSTRTDGTVVSHTHMCGSGQGVVLDVEEPVESTEVDDEPKTDDTPVVEAVDPMKDPAVVALLKEKDDEIARLQAELKEAKAPALVTPNPVPSAVTPAETEDFRCDDGDPELVGMTEQELMSMSFN